MGKILAAIFGLVFGLFMLLYVGLAIGGVATYGRMTLDAFKKKDPFAILLGIVFTGLWVFITFRFLDYFRH